MVKVIIKTYGSANKAAGWNSQEVKLEKEKVTLADVLRRAKLADGGSLFDLIADGNVLKDSYGIFLSGRFLSHPVDLTMGVKDGDYLAILDYPFMLGGG